jgi:hypothetical protein
MWNSLLIPQNVELFINLTAGLEHLEMLHVLHLNFIRMQSTHLEHKHLEHFLKDLDNNFLMKLAIGKECVILDFTSRKKKNNVSRACWQGIPWIEYCLNRLWFGKRIECKYGMHKCFEHHFSKLSSCTKRKIKYYRKFVLTNSINLRYVCGPTDNDSNTKYYQSLIKKYLKI